MFAVITFLVLCLSLSDVLAKCPNQDNLCYCELHQVYCRGNFQQLDLGQLLLALNSTWDERDKQANRFLILENTALVELKDDLFRDINLRFIQIEIRGNDQLKTIDRNVFTGGTTIGVTQEIIIENNRELSSQSVFEALNQFTNVVEIQLKDNAIQAIEPDFADHNNLTHLHFWGTKYTKLVGRTFAKLNNLKQIVIANTNITEIPEDAFAIDKPGQTGQSLQLDIDANNAIDGAAFRHNSLANIGRPTTIYFSNKSLKYLNETVFKPFFDDNPKNRWYSEHQLDCNDCKNVWLKQLDSSRFNADNICSNSKTFNDHDNFKDC